ncbi:MAG: twin-arginine translocase TatA/TatE family subunit [Candidatus Hydrogenedentota bacterium]
MHWGPWELFIILAIVLVIFGGGKLAGIGKSLGTAVSEFKDAVRPEDEENAQHHEEKPGDQTS